MADPTPSPSDPAAEHRAAWQAWEQALVDAVLGLHDGHEVSILAPPGHVRLTRARSGRMRWLAGARRRPVAPSVRLVRVEDHLRGHWSGAERFGGPFPWTREEEEAVLACGWHRPTVGDGEDFVRFWPDDVPRGRFLPLDDARRAAAAVAHTFRVVLAVTPDGGEPEGGLPAVRHDAG
ncbi:MAG: hypothetical protein IE926_11815 [Micrococcales bacterium]|nr:hypothetical protein [Micrococcales bacterium]